MVSERSNVIARGSLCVFCFSEVGQEIGNPGVQGIAATICAKCVDSAYRLLNATHEVQPRRVAPALEDIPDDELAFILERSQTTRDEVEERIRSWVAAARHRKWPWAKIGTLLGMTRQSAWERYGV